MITRRISLALAALMLVSTAISCGGSASTGESTTAAGGDTAETTAAKPEYEFPKFTGEVRVLNIDDCFSMHARVDTVETNGDTLNDTQYNTVRKFEEMTGTTWVEQNEEVNEGVSSIIKTAIPAGDDLYDIIYQSNSRYYYALSSEGYFYNILDYDEADLSQPWWIDSFNSEMIVNGKLFTALGHSHLCTTDAISCLYFNQTIMEDLGLELPYQTVIDGKWTMDKLGEYTKKAANLNGDDSFAWKDDGKALYGMVVVNSYGGFYNQAGEQLIDNNNGKLVLNGGSERFYQACEASAKLLGAEGQVYQAPNSGDDTFGSYISVFEIQRALFGASEVCKANRMRNMDFTFGILPFPKLDETQDRYYCGVSYPACGIAIPVTCKTPERSAALGDAINYLFYKDVWPVFREVTLEQKNLRNEESIEILDIILNSTAPVISTIYGIGADYTSQLGAKLRQGDSAVTSILASHKDAIQAELDKINNQ